jgi:hypothetical protein
MLFAISQCQLYRRLCGRGAHLGGAGSKSHRLDGQHNHSAATTLDVLIIYARLSQTRAPPPAFRSAAVDVMHGEHDFYLSTSCLHPGNIKQLLHCNLEPRSRDPHAPAAEQTLQIILRRPTMGTGSGHLRRGQHSDNRVNLWTSLALRTCRVSC